MPNPLSLRPSGLVLNLPLVWAVLLGLLAVRLFALAVSPLGPGVDEAHTGCGVRPRNWAIIPSPR